MSTPRLPPSLVGEIRTVNRRLTGTERRVTGPSTNTGLPLAPATEAPTAVYPRQITINALGTPYTVGGSWYRTAVPGMFGAATLRSGVLADSVAWQFTAAEGTYDLDLVHLAGTGTGIYTVTVDDIEVGTVDGYNAISTATVTTLAGIDIPASGDHVLGLEMNTKNGASSGYGGDVDSIILTRL